MKMRMTYETAVHDQERFNETNDCTVKAYAITKNIDYATARAVCAGAGRKARQGMSLDQIAKSLGVRVQDFRGCRQEFGKRVTPKTFAKMFPKGRYYCVTRNHAIAIVDGVVEDWTASRRNQIMFFIEVK